MPALSSKALADVVVLLQSKCLMMKGLSRVSGISIATDVNEKDAQEAMVHLGYDACWDGGCPSERDVLHIADAMRETTQTS